MIDKAFWNGKKVFITGHTGFKGAWLCLWLHELGADVAGYALEPPTEPSLYELCGVDRMVKPVIGDVRDGASLARALAAHRPEIVIHMAAQPLVRDSYKIPVETYAVNVIGTVNLFEAVRTTAGVRAVLNVTTDKCYENREWVWGYRENEPLGGYDPYSSSKACSELVTAAYRSSYFQPETHAKHGVAVATARAGNVIGGGDWATDRLVPDCMRAILQGQKVLVRNPRAIRPWQHVLEPLCGYLMLAERLVQEGVPYAGAWNFGPDDIDARPVEWLVSRLCSKWGNASYTIDQGQHPHEAHFLKLDCSKAKASLGWQPRWRLEKAIDSVIAWTKAYAARQDCATRCFDQIREYQSAAGRP